MSLLKMNFRQISLLLLMVCATALPAKASQELQWQEEPELTRLFEESGVKATFVLYDPETQIYHGNYRGRAEYRFYPASTFKILNSLIAFETGAVKSEQEVFHYDGKPRDMKMWQKDMILKEAIEVSNVPVYQEVARRIGLQRMQNYIDEVNYGNRKVGKVVDRFWLDGPLKISAVEQVQFIQALLQRTLPFSAHTYDSLHHIMPHLQLEDKSGELFYKTGLSGKNIPRVGWVVGWVEKGGKQTPFAMNMNLAPGSNGESRMLLVQEALTLLGRN